MYAYRGKIPVLVADESWKEGSNNILYGITISRLFECMF